MIRLGNRQFKPGLWPSIAFLVLLPVLIRLGFWQLSRADEKQQLKDALQMALEQPPVKLTSPFGNVDGLRYRKVQLEGQYLGDHVFLLDNQVYKGKPGYHVLTPLQLLGSQDCVLIDRGWIEPGPTRQKLPHVETDSANTRVFGEVSLSFRDAFRLGERGRVGTGWPALVQWIDIPELSKELPCNLQDLLVRLDVDAAQGFVREWPKPLIQPEKSLSYAVQWFMLALALIVIYFVVNFKKSKS